MTLAARILDDLAAAVTVRTCLLHREKALTHLHLAGAVAGRAGLGTAAGVGTGAVTDFTVNQSRHLDLLGDPAYRLFQRQLHGVTQVGATGRATTGTTTATAEDVTEYVTKHVGEVGTAAKATVATATLARVDTGMAVLVVTGTQVGIGQDLVGFLDLFELLFGCGITLITIRVILHGQALVRLLNLAIVGIFRHTQYFVEIALRHTHPVVTQTGVGYPTPVNSLTKPMGEADFAHLGRAYFLSSFTSSNSASTTSSSALAEEED